MIRLSVGVALIWMLACAPASAQTAQDKASAPDAPAAAQNSVKLTDVYVELAAGAPYISLRGGGLCIGRRITKTWPGGRVESSNFGAYRAVFKQEMEAAGYKVITPGQDNLFDPEAGAADYEIAGVITGLMIDGCTGDGFYTEKGTAKGDVSMTIDWQVYARLRKQLVAHVKTTGTSKLDERVLGGLQQLVAASFTDNLRKLIENLDVRAALNAPRGLRAGFQMPGAQSPIALAGSLKVGHRKIADATGSVVTILNSSGTGSGFLVSSDGYILTDAHVVGDDKDVRVRWPDGIETLAKVERVSKSRDVAIIKTNPRDRAPLAIKRGPVTPGQRVYAIGSPKGKSFEGTVTSGIISADRTVDGLRYIQSDTMVSHGSSGGPLLDENGAVIGLTDLGISNAGPTGAEEGAGLNLFTPIGDAMDFLALEQK